MELSESTVEKFQTVIDDDWNTFIADWVRIAQVPAPTSDEDERAATVAELFREYGADTVERDTEGNVIARTQETRSPTFALTAHLDTVFDRSIDHNVTLNDRTIQGPGVGDDSLGLAALVSLLRILPEQDRGDCLLVATCETEGDGNLRGSRVFLDQFSDELDFALCLEGHRLGRIDHRSLGTHRVRIQAQAEGGHVWRDQTGQNPIEVLARLISEIKQLPTPEGEEDGIINFGMIRGGSAYNTVPYQAELKVEMRASRRELLHELSDGVEEAIQTVQKQTSVTMDVDTVSRRPVASIGPDHWLVSSVEDVHRQIGLESRLGAASSDSSVFLDAGVPAVTLGLGRGKNKHRPEESIELSSVREGSLQLLLTIIETCGRFRTQAGG